MQYTDDIQMQVQVIQQSNNKATIDELNKYDVTLNDNMLILRCTFEQIDERFNIVTRS